MWTPRRIFLGLVGLLAVAMSYFGYARVLGTFDGLPPLPDHYKNTGNPPAWQPSTPLGTVMDRKCELAFGPNCSELHYPIRTEMHAKGLLLAAVNFQIIPAGEERAGWMKLWPLSLASFGKKLGPDGTPEINTLYADVAYLRFDQPIKALTDLSGRKIIAAELHADPAAILGDDRKGRIRIQNNRRTLDINDDVELVTPGPVYYDDEPKPGKPNIYTFTDVHVFDHLNTDLPVPDRSVPRPPTVAGVGMRVFLTPEPKDKKQSPKTGEPRLPIPRKDPKPGLTGVDLIELEQRVEMNLWTDANASFVAPGGGPAPKKEPKDTAAAPKAGPADAKKTVPAADKRLLQIRTNGPFRYDLTKELAHFEKPANAKPGLPEHVQVTRIGRTTGQDMLDCEYLDVQFQRKKPPPPTKDAPPAPKKDAPPGAGDGDLEVKSIRAWGETVVITSDSENLHATGVELIHEAEAKMTVLKGDAMQQMQAVKDGNLIRGSELHLFGDGKEISQAHVLGAGSVGLGDLDPKTGEYQKQATWTDRFVFVRQVEKDKPSIDILTFLGKDGGKAMFKDTSNGELRQIEAVQLRVGLKTPDKEKEGKDGKEPPARKPQPKKGAAGKDDPKPDIGQAAKPLWVEAIGDVRSTSPDVVIKHTDELNVWFRDVPQLIKPPGEPTDPKDGKGPAKTPGTKAPIDPKEAPSAKGPVKADPADKKEEPKKEAVREKKPLVVSARKIETWMNRDPKGRNEIDHVVAKGDVEAHQDPATKDELGTDIAGDTVEMQAYAEGNRLLVTGDQYDRKKLKWGVVRFDKLTIFGFDIVIDQRSNTSAVKGEGSMEIVSATDLEGKKLEKPTTVRIYWKHKMDFLGVEKLIYFHGAVQAYQEASRLKCEWMQVVLDRPVFLNQATRPKPVAKKLQPGQKKEDDNPKIDTVMCFHAPKDEEIPKPKTIQPVTVVEEIKDGERILRFQSIQGPDVVNVSTPLENGKERHEMIVTSSETMPGVARIWQPGPKDALADKPEGKAPDSKKKDPPKKKGELAADEEMKLTVIQFGGKMIANDFRKWAKFFENIRVVHLAADSPTTPVDLREGDIPKGAVYLECRDRLDVLSTVQKERDPKTGQMVDKTYQEMIAVGNVRVRKQGEFFGDADRVTYSELKGTLTFHGDDRNPAEVREQKGTGVATRPLRAKTIIYYVRSKTFESQGTIGIGQ